MLFFIRVVMVILSLYGNKTLTMIGDFSENEESVYAASLLSSSWVFTQRTERHCRDTCTPVLTEPQFPVLSYGTSLAPIMGEWAHTQWKFPTIKESRVLSFTGKWMQL